MTVTFMLEVRCHYSAHWFNVGGSHTGIQFVRDCHHVLMFTVTYVMKNSFYNNSIKKLQTKIHEQKCKFSDEVKKGFPLLRKMSTVESHFKLNYWIALPN
jgi:hypothetical protein